MNEHVSILVVVVLAVVVLLVFVIVRNRKDEKVMEQDMDEVIPKPHKHPGEEDGEV